MQVFGLVLFVARKHGGRVLTRLEILNERASPCNCNCGDCTTQTPSRNNFNANCVPNIKWYTVGLPQVALFTGCDVVSSAPLTSP